MKHIICVNARDLAQSLKDACSYTLKDNPDNAMSYVLLTIASKSKKLSIIGCDGLGYYERRLYLANKRPSLPGKDKNLFISCKDASMLIKLIPGRENRNAAFELEEEIVNACYSVKFQLPDGISTSFFSPCNMAMPNYAAIKINVEKGRKKAPNLEGISIPVNEMLRAGRVFPAKDSFAQIFTSKGLRQGIMALLECKDEQTDISVIFMLSQIANQAA